jgi:CHAT domain-containing protein
VSLLEMYRRNVQSKREEISRLMQEKAREQKKVADLSTKINAASQAMSRTKSTSTIQTKLKDIERYQNELARVEKKLADLETKISSKQKALSDEEKKVAREEERELNKRILDAKKQEQVHQKRMTEMQRTLLKHDRLHTETLSVLERLQKLPERIVVLFLAANPLDHPQLRLDEEARAIADMIRKARHRDSVKLESCWAVRPMDVLQALNEFSPAIVHFSGHGSTDDAIVFQDAQGNAKMVSKDAIVQTMMASSEGIRLVFFNTCYSRNQAEAVVEHVEAAIGMNTSIGDEAARVFASQFYSSIGFGYSVKKAFDQARALLMMEGIPEEDTPELFVHNGVDSEKLVIVRPNIEES